MFPPENRAEDTDHQLDPRRHGPVLPRNLYAPVALLPLLAHLQKPLGVIGADAVETLANRPAHLLLVVNGPRVHRPTFPSGFSEEARSEVGDQEGLHEHVEGDVGGAEELAGVGRGEADVGDGEGGEVLGAEGEVLCRPAAEDDALIPGFLAMRRDEGDGFGDQADDVGCVIVELVLRSEGGWV